MPPKKLSDSDKQEILSQYRNSDETTVTLAVQYGVSTSTISRFLKQSLAEPEYEALVQRKRSGGRIPAQALLPGLVAAAGLENVGLENPGLEDTEAVVSLAFDPPKLGRSDPERSAFDASELSSFEDPGKPERRQRRRVTAGFISAEQLAASVAHLSQLEQAPLTKNLDEPLAGRPRRLEPALSAEAEDFEPDDFAPVPEADLPDLEADADPDLDPEDLAADRFAEFAPGQFDADDFGPNREPSPSGSSSAKPAPKLARPLPVPKAAEDLDDDDDDLTDLDDDDLDSLDDDELEDDFDESDALSSLDSMRLQPNGQLQILPLQETALPRTCYVVVDRSSELITRPLKDFADLGQIRSQETQEKTLPIFDNHRVAKRFLRRMQRIVKVPDGRVFQKVKPYLQAKGITHLLIDGQIYSLQ